jgi:hypothetical protein
VTGILFSLALKSYNRFEIFHSQQVCEKCARGCLALSGIMIARDHHALNLFLILPSLAQKVLILNPMLSVVSAYHDIFVFQRMPSFFYLAVVLIASLVLIVVDYVIFKKLEKDIRDFI